MAAFVSVRVSQCTQSSDQNFKVGAGSGSVSYSQNSIDERSGGHDTFH